MQQVMIELPNTSLQLIKLSIDAFVEELRLATATQFYRQNRLTLDVAAQLAGLTADEFSQEFGLVEKSEALGRYDNGSDIWPKGANAPNVIPSPMPKEPDILDLRLLAEQQGVQPIKDIKDFQTGFWPEDESIDDFIQTIRAWRDESLAVERVLPQDD